MGYYLGKNRLILRQLRKKEGKKDNAMSGGFLQAWRLITIRLIEVSYRHILRHIPRRQRGSLEPGKRR